MLKLVLDDSLIKNHLYPFTLTRSAADIRIGILTIRQKWEKLLGKPISVNSDDFLSSPVTEAGDFPAVFSANIIPSQSFINALLKGSYNEANFLKQEFVRILQHPWHIFEYNDWALRQDFELITKGRHSMPIPEWVQTIGSRNIFVEEGAILNHCVLNASSGPIYIGKNAEVLEGATIRGPFSLGENSVVKMGARIYGATTVGPYCTVGGEIKNAVFFGYSNKAHDGYLGDAVIGEWCNLGAGSSNSNIKNTASPVTVWNNATKEFTNAGIKCGLFMGDYSRCAINTSFNTGTVVGACCSIFGEGLTPKNIPSFAWGNKGVTRYEFEKALKDIQNWKQLKKQSLTEKEIQILQHIFEHTF